MMIRRRIRPFKAMNRPFRILLFLVGVCLVCCIGWPILSQLAFGKPGYFDFTLHRGEYERIVRIAKAMPVASDSATETNIEGLTVTVERDPKGFCIVTIRTLDWGHAGDYGYAYSDVPLVPVDDLTNMDNPEETILPITSDLNEINRRINAHWWSVYNGRN